MELPSFNTSRVDAFVSPLFVSVTLAKDGLTNGTPAKRVHEMFSEMLKGPKYVDGIQTDYFTFF